VGIQGTIAAVGCAPEGFNPSKWHPQITD